MEKLRLSPVFISFFTDRPQNPESEQILSSKTNLYLATEELSV